MELIECIPEGSLTTTPQAMRQALFQARALGQRDEQQHQQELGRANALIDIINFAIAKDDIERNQMQVTFVVEIAVYEQALQITGREKDE